jgi:hypothetical protein
MISLLISWISSSKIRGHVPATSMLETVVSMTILLSILTISFVTIDRINSSMNPAAQYKAHLISNEVLNRDDILLEEMDEYEVDGYRVIKKVVPLAKGTSRVELTIMNGFGKTVFIRKILISHEIKL